MIDVVLEAADATGEVISWKTQTEAGSPLKKLVDSWIDRCYVGKKEGYHGAGLEKAEEPGQLDLSCTPSQLDWQIGDPCRTLWVVPLDSRNEAPPSLPKRACADENATDSASCKAKRAKRSSSCSPAATEANASPAESSAASPANVAAAPSPAKGPVPAHAKATSASLTKGAGAKASSTSTLALIAKKAAGAGKTPASPAAKSGGGTEGATAVPSGDDPIEFLKDNPKRSGSAAGERYDKYKHAKTVQKAKDAGAWEGDIINDFKKGFLKCRST